MTALKNFNVQIVLSLILGVAAGIFFPAFSLDIAVLGKLFVALLKMLVVPLVFAGIFIAIAGLGSLAHLRQMGLRTVGLYLLTTHWPSCWPSAS